MALVHNKTAKVHTVGLTDSVSVTLLPGINEISDDLCAKVESHPHFKQRVKSEQMIVLNSPKLDKDGRKSVDDMLKYIPKIYDTKALRKIIKDETREVVILAAKEQLESIVNPKPADNPNDEHFR